MMGIAAGDIDNTQNDRIQPWIIRLSKHKQE